jgi:hypothetical protein
MTPGPPDATLLAASVIRQALVPMAAFYLILYYGIARVGGAFLYSAVTGAALLIGLTMPVFAALSWVSARAHCRCEEPPDGAQSPPQ